jgi:hypothetical protein
MSTISHEPVTTRAKREWPIGKLAPEVWASLAIGVMWLAVVFAAIFGPDIVTNSNDGNSARIPSGAAVALFAFLATWVLAKYAFRRGARD